ncbi:hypothetical protein P9112_005528 [Eukaryota sp. TZLM1-RC]
MLQKMFTLGQRETSRVEAMYSVLKRYIKVTNLDIVDFSARAKELFMNVVEEHRIQRERDIDLAIVCNDRQYHFLEPVVNEIPNS